MHFAVFQTGLLNKLPTAQSRRVLYKTSLFRFLYNAVTAIVANLPTFFEPPIIRAERSHQYNKKKTRHSECITLKDLKLEIVKGAKDICC